MPRFLPLFAVVEVADDDTVKVGSSAESLRTLHSVNNVDVATLIASTKARCSAAVADRAALTAALKEEMGDIALAEFDGTDAVRCPVWLTLDSDDASSGDKKIKRKSVRALPAANIEAKKAALIAQFKAIITFAEAAQIEKLHIDGTFASVYDQLFPDEIAPSKSGHHGVGQGMMPEGINPADMMGNMMSGMMGGGGHGGPAGGQQCQQQ
jgi:hypothetical protein